MSEDVVEVAPHSDEAERAVLGCVLLNNGIFPELAATLAVEDFYRPSHRILWEVIGRLIRRGDAADQITVADALGEQRWEDVGGAVAVNALTSNVPSVWSVRSYAETVRRHATARKMILQLRRAEQRLREPDVALEDVASGIAKAAQEVWSASSDKTTLAAAEVDAEWERRFLEAINTETGGGTSTGIEGMDGILGGGLKGGRYIALAALPKMGKTTLALAVAAKVLFRDGWAVDVISVEMRQSDLYDKMIAWESGIDLNEYRQRCRDVQFGEWRATEEEETAFLAAKDRIWDARAKLRNAPLYLTTDGAPNIHDVAMMLRARQLELSAAGRDPKKHLVILDYIQNFECGGHRRGDDTGRIAEVSRTINKTIKALDIPALVICQFDKTAEKATTSAGETPRFSQLRGSTQIGNDANNLIVYHRPYREEEGSGSNYTLLVSELSRDGKMGTRVELEADLPRNRFRAWRRDEMARSASLEETPAQRQLREAQERKEASWRKR